MDILTYAVPVLMVLLLVVLGVGLYHMTRQGQEHREKSNKMMRMRILVQGCIIALLLLMAVLAQS